MNQAQELFEKLQSLRDASELLSFCSQTLGAVERIHFDFKEKHDRSHPKLDLDDKKNLAKAVSGFANSGGGVLIWGIENDKLEPKPISNVQQFVQNLLQLAPRVTDPLTEKIDGCWISSEDGNAGFGIVLIPESTLPPHRVILENKDVQNYYYVRSGNSFLIAPHTILEDMFGRRPKPSLGLVTKIQSSGYTNKTQDYEILLGLENTGRGVAKSPFFSISVNKPYTVSKYGVDGNKNFGLPRIAQARGTFGARYGSNDGFVIHSGMLHYITAISIELDSSRLSDFPDVVIDYEIAAEGIMLFNGQKVIAINEISKYLE